MYKVLLKSLILSTIFVILAGTQTSKAQNPNVVLAEIPRGGSADKVFRLRHSEYYSFKCSGGYLRHSNYVISCGPIKSDLDKQDATFLVRGAADGQFLPLSAYDRDNTGGFKPNTDSGVAFTPKPPQKMQRPAMALFASNFPDHFVVFNKATRKFEITKLSADPARFLNEFRQRGDFGMFLDVEGNQLGQYVFGDLQVVPPLWDPTSRTPVTTSTPAPVPTPAPTPIPQPTIAPNLVLDSSGNNLLHTAVRNGDISAATNSIGIGLNVNAANFAGETPVTMAVDRRNSQMLLMLLSKGGNLITAVTRLIKVGDEQTLRLIARQYNVRLTNQMFDSAIAAGNYGIAQFGLERGVDSNYALKSILQRNIVQLVAPVLKAGANADPALKYGMEKGDISIATMALQSYRANPKLGLSLGVAKSSLPIVQLALSLGANATEVVDDAVKLGNVQIITALLDRGGDANAGMANATAAGNRQIIELLVNRGANATTAMPYAVKNNDLPLVNFLLGKGANAANPALISAAVSKQNRAMTEALIAAGADPTNGLQSAIKANNLEFTRFLLEKNADAKKSDDFILDAAAQKNREMVDLLLENGASPTPGLAGAVNAGDSSLAKYLIEKGANVKDSRIIQTAARGIQVSMVELLLRNGANAEDGMSEAVNAAASNVSPESEAFKIVKLLIANGAKATSPGYMVAASKAANVPMVELLLKNGADAENGMKEAINAAISGSQSSASVEEWVKCANQNEFCNFEGQQLVRYAAADGRKTEVVKKGGVRCNDADFGDPAPGFAKQCFIKAPSNQNQPQPNRTESSAFKVVELLIANGAKATAPEYIISACKMANVPLATLLLNNNAPKNAIDELGQPLVHIAALTWNTDIVTAILSLGVDPNAKNRAGDTALHIVGDDAASKDYPKFQKKKRDRIPMMNALIAGKADVNAIDAKGDFVLKRSNDDYIKDLLKAAGAVKDQKELDKRGTRPIQ